MSQWNETFIFLACREHRHEKKFLFIGYNPSSLDCFSIRKKLQRVFSSTLHFAWQFSCKWNWWRVILPQTQICKLGRTKFYIHRRDPFNQKFPEISFQTRWIGSVQPEKFRKKLVHLLRWTTFPGQTGQNFGWMDRTVLSHGEVLISLIILLQVLLSSWSSERKVHLFICVWLRTCSPISSWLERIRNSLICCRIQ